MLYEVTLVGGNKRTFEDAPEVGMAGELMFQVEIEVVEGLSTSMTTEQVIFAPHSWRCVEPFAEGVEDG